MSGLRNEAIMNVADELDFEEDYVAELFDFLDDVRESGIMNMFESPAYIAKNYELERHEAHKIVSAWMHSFGK